MAGSRDPTKAQAFLDEHVPNGGSAQSSGAYAHKAKSGTYEDVYNDPVGFGKFVKWQLRLTEACERSCILTAVCNSSSDRKSM
jgi:hypothetical protein